MKWFYDFKIRNKLFVFMGFAIFIPIILSVLSYIEMNKHGNIQDESYKRSLQSELAVNGKYIGYELYDVIADAVINRNIDNSKKLWAEKKSSTFKLLNQLNENADTNEEKQWIKDATTSANSIIQIFEEKMLPELIKNKDTTEVITELDSQIDRFKHEITKAMENYSISLAKESLLSDSEFDSTSKNSIFINVLVSTLAIIIIIAFSIFLINSITRPLKQIMEVANKIADGNFDVNLEVKTKDETGMLMHSFNEMADKLNEAMHNIIISAELVASGANQMSMSAQVLSQGSTEQASSIEEITSSMTEVSTQTKHNALNANQANELAVIAKNNALSGNKQMQEMLMAMTEINSASTNISKIIKVIDEIAFQTNILALNAAVEAARAGHLGKGFAVVAEEVRNLAARSADAAKETTAMIEGSINKVNFGTKIANETALALDKIVNDVTKAADIVGGIAGASNEQASAIAQVNIAIEQVSEVVQTNSATAEETAAASEELSGQANMLREVVSKFKLKSSTGGKNFDGLTPEMFRMIENMMGKNKRSENFHLHSNNKPNINLMEEKDFMKY